MVAASPGGSVSDAMREKQVTPLLKPGSPVTSTYVDNVAVIGGSPSDTDRRMAGIADKASSLALPFDLTHLQ